MATEERATPQERKAKFTTLSGEPVEALYGPQDLPAFEEIGAARASTRLRAASTSRCTGAGCGRCGSSPGFGTSEETNERFRYLLDHGQTGLSTAFDMPSLMGHDSDHARSLGEVGREGVAVDTLDDMETLFDGIDLGEVTVSMTINAPAAIMLAFYVVAAEDKGVPADRLGGTIQADILKEYIAQKEWCFPIDPAMRLLGDMVEWCSREMPRWHPVSISGYHIREAGSTAQQELAFTLKDGLTYVEQAVERGLDVDDFAPRLSFFFNAQIDFFEEIAKYRAARRIWAREMRETFGAQNPRSWLMRFHTQTAGVRLTAQQPLNNIVRTTIEALAGVLGGTQSLHTNSYDEALALPTEEAVRIALRTQQIIAEETGVPNTADPLGGSYFVEALTDKMEEAAYAYFRQASTSSAGWSRRSSRTTRSARSPTRRTTCSARSTRASGSSSASTPTSTSTRRRCRSCASTRRSSASRSAASRRVRAQARRPPRSTAALANVKNAAGDESEPHAAPSRRRTCSRHRGRDRGGAPAGLGLLHARAPSSELGGSINAQAHRRPRRRRARRHGRSRRHPGVRRDEDRPGRRRLLQAQDDQGQARRQDPLPLDRRQPAQHQGRRHQHRHATQRFEDGHRATVRDDPLHDPPRHDRAGSGAVSALLQRVS